MTPLSEADSEIRAAVVALTGECQCSRETRDANAWLCRREGPRYDPGCHFHQMGEHFANLFREVRRLKRIVQQTHHHRQVRKVN